MIFPPRKNPETVRERDRSTPILTVPSTCTFPLLSMAMIPIRQTWPTYLSEDVAGYRLIQIGTTVNELKQIHATAKLLHHHLKKVLILKTVNQLQSTK